MSEGSAGDATTIRHRGVPGIAPAAPPAPAASGNRSREVRLGLVFNGGVSLAVWIGGVTREIDAARRGSIGRETRHDTSELYRQILDTLDDDLVVDVIAGASAGGINGVLLGSAIYNDVALDRLQETWLTIGDFRRLLRPVALPDPPSLMQGDDVVLGELTRVINGLWSTTAQRPSNPLYVYVTATDLFGFPADFEDSRGESFEERDHRRVFSFEHQPADPDTRFAYDDTAYTKDLEHVMRSVVCMEDPDAPELLARAARCSSSFPVAFEAHNLSILDDRKRRNVRGRANAAANGGGENGETKPLAHWMVDGGILDNQPFNPVLDRVAILPAGKPVRRAVVYIVPYATNVGSTLVKAPDSATARDTYTAAGSLPRDLPKLQSLERITRERVRQGAAEAERERVLAALSGGDLRQAAAALFDGYRAARFCATQSVFEYWADPRFRPGSGTIAQHPADDPHDLLAAPTQEIERRSVPWIPETPDWSPDEPSWQWGLSPAERAATWALLLLRDAATAEAARTDARARDLNIEARKAASQLIARSRKAKIAFRKEFIEAGRSAAQLSPGAVAPDVVTRAANAYAQIQNHLVTLQGDFRALDVYLRNATGGRGVAYLLHLEVARSGTAINDGNAPAPFNFIFASARVDNSLGHQAKSPGEKLAGMKLNHFGGFLKRSWRANDWLWGRLDGVEHMLRVLIDEKVIADLDDARQLALARIAFPDPDEETLPGAIEALHARWQETWADLGEGEPSRDPRGDLANLLGEVRDRRRSQEERDIEKRAKYTDACRRALAARLQLRILASDLRRVAETAEDDIAGGSSRIASGAFWANRYPLGESELDAPRLVSLFQDMNVGSETLADESSSRLALDVGAQTAALAAAVFAGDRGGLPTAARSALGSVRSSTLAISRLVRLIAREPWLGAAAVAILVALLVWGAVSKNTIVGATLPALALLVVVSGLSLLTIATSVLEQSATKISRIAALVAFAGVPVSFALITRWPRLSDRVANWFDAHTGHAVTSIAAIAALTAAAAAVARVGGGGTAWLAKRLRKIDLGHGWVRTILLVYRAAVAVGMVTLGIGFIIERTLDRSGGSWVAVADEKRGTLLIIMLVAVLLVVSLVEEGAGWLHRERHALALRWTAWRERTRRLAAAPREREIVPGAGESIGTGP